MQKKTNIQRNTTHYFIAFYEKEGKQLKRKIQNLSIAGQWKN